MLRCCLFHDGDPCDVPPNNWDAVVTASRKHFVAPLLYLSLRNKEGVPSSVISRLEAMYHSNLKSNIRRLNKLAEFLNALQNDHIPSVVLKGCFISESIYENVGARIFGDADIMVKPEDVDRAHRCLTKVGAFSPESGPPVDLHWYLEDALNLDMDRIWSRIQPAVIGGISTHGLSPEDLLIHLCLHMGFHHNYEFGGLRSLCDIREIISRHGDRLDWGYIASTATNGEFAKAIYLPLHLAKTLVSAQVPEDALSSLCPDPILTEPVQWALSQMFHTKPFDESPALSPNFWSLWASGSLWKKVVSFLKLLYPDRKYIAQKYPTSPRSMKTYFYYMVRMKRHIFKYLSVCTRIIMNESEMKRILERERRNIHMRAWMTDGDGKKRYTV